MHINLETVSSRLFFFFFFFFFQPHGRSPKKAAECVAARPGGMSNPKRDWYISTTPTEFFLI
jgi:hypothetical protein